MAHVDIDTAEVRGAGTAIAAALTEQGISQRELARRLGWPQPRIQRRIAGDIPTTVADMKAVAAALGVPVTKLLPAGKRRAS